MALVHGRKGAVHFAAAANEIANVVGFTLKASVQKYDVTALQFSATPSSPPTSRSYDVDSLITYEGTVMVLVDDTSATGAPLNAGDSEATATFSATNGKSWSGNIVLSKADFSVDRNEAMTITYEWKGTDNGTPFGRDTW